MVILIEVPQAIYPPEAAFVAITTSPEIRYFSLEMTSQTGQPSDMYVLGEWTSEGTHYNYGEVNDASPNGFLRAICGQLALTETVEPPLAVQTEGMQRGTPWINLTMPATLDAEDAACAQIWTQDAQAAVTVQDYPRAEELYRQLLELWMAKQGPSNTLATLQHDYLAKVLMLQGKHAEAEAVCQEWWKICRRYRMIGHAETLLSTRTLAECLRDQGKREAALKLMRYRVLLASLSRGAESQQAVQTRSEMALFLR